MKDSRSAVPGSSLLLWLTPFILASLQLLFVLHAQREIRYEELAEAVRNPYYLQYRLVYDGVSSNVGWYGILLLCYTLFGFTLYSALYLRLAMYLVSMCLLALILRRYLGAAFAIVPLAIIGLSPTLLYFNAVETSYGIDLEFFIVCLYLILSLDDKRQARSYLISALIGFSAAFASLCYPIFLDYLPSLAILYVWRLPATFFRRPRAWLGLIGVVTLSFLAPIAVVLGTIRNRSALVYDSHTHGGLFRGGGNLRFQWQDFTHAMSGVLNDLFLQGNSYYFNITKPEFSGYYPIIAVAMITLICGFLSVKLAPLRLPILLAFLGVITTLVVVGITSDGSGLPGMRRATPILATFYGCMTVVWVHSVNSKRRLDPLKYLGIGSCGLLLLHAVLVFPINLSDFPGPGATTDSAWFTIAPTPQASLNVLVTKAERADLYLPCPEGGHERTPCRYNEVFPAIAGSCLWNRLDCHAIYGVDLKTNRYRPLNVGLWAAYTFAH